MSNPMFDSTGLAGLDPAHWGGRAGERGVGLGLGRGGGQGRGLGRGVRLERGLGIGDIAGNRVRVSCHMSVSQSIGEHEVNRKRERQREDMDIKKSSHSWIAERQL